LLKSGLLKLIDRTINHEYLLIQLLKKKNTCRSTLIHYSDSEPTMLTSMSVDLLALRNCTCVYTLNPV